MEQQAFEYQPLTVNADYSRIMIGNSCYMDDIWDVTPYMSDVAVKDTKEFDLVFLPGITIKNL